MRISRVLHAGYIFDDGKTSIIVDPIFENPFSKNCFAYPQIRFDTDQIESLKFSAIFISHFHDDHCSLESLNYLDRNTPIYFHCIHEELFDLIHELGFEKLIKLEFDQTIEVGEFKITPRKPFDCEIDSMLQISLNGINVLNVVDSVIDPANLSQLQKLGPWDLVLWPFQTMRETAVLSPSRAIQAEPEIPAEWIEELSALNPRYIVPSSCQFLQESWSWYNRALFPISYQKFEQTLLELLPSAKVVRLNPGQSFILNEKSLKADSPLSWLTLVGEQDVDYIFQPHILPPPTKEIASRFKPLNSVDRDRTFSFCTTDLLSRFRELEPTPFFSKPRIWRLSIFDHLKVETCFHYLIDKSSISLIEDGAPSWVTEVPDSRLFSALEHGEALTSMYVRVNDLKFSEDVEQELSEMDVLEDPLIRVLFNGKLGAYQREQLRKIKSSVAEMA